MTKKDLVALCAGEWGLSKGRTETMLNSLFTTILDSTVQDGKFKYGKIHFKLRKHAARKARHPVTGTIMAVPEKTFVEFKRRVG